MKNASESDNEKDRSFDDLFQYAESLGFGELHMKLDKKTGLSAIIAMHSTKLGPAIGGCRCIRYDSVKDAIRDALRLAQMMTYKASISGLPHGGGKAVLIRPKEIKDREAYFEAFGSFVDELDGRYITAVDSGTSTADMDIVARKTKYVTCTQHHYAREGDPSSYTARGVLRSIQAAVKFTFDRDDIAGIHIAVQGAGHVGYQLARELHRAGAQISMCDIDEKSVQRCVEEFKVNVVNPEGIYEIPCDVFSPCALGAVLNEENIHRLKAPIVAGSANNQLARPEDGGILHERGILYAPDFLANAGGLIRVATMYDHETQQKADDKIHHIYHKLLSIFQRSRAENIPTSQIAFQLAQENLE
ncbi:MAG: amino acid dehydrogenase [Proteobacteria bacterium]|nr:amino acid dehydrogenase [Pseudomonadota bacterium]